MTSLAVDGQELLAGASLVWVVYKDTGGLYRIGSERSDCPEAEFVELSQTRFEALSLVEAGPARVTLRGTATIDGRPMIVDLSAAAGATRLELRVTGSAATDRTIMLRVQPAAPDDALAMGVAAGVVTRPLAHLYEQAGSLTNLAGRVQRIDAGGLAPRQAKADWAAIANLASALGRHTPDELSLLRAELAAANAAYAAALSGGLPPTGRLIGAEEAADV